MKYILSSYIPYLSLFFVQVFPFILRSTLSSFRVRTGLEKSLKKHHVLEKSLNFLQKSLSIFEISLNKK